MSRYILTRLAALLVTVTLVSAGAFWLSLHHPTDPAETACTGDRLSAEAYARCLHKERRRLNQHLPLFYFEIASLAEPDTLSRVLPPSERDALRQWTLRSGHWPLVHQWRAAVYSLKGALPAQASQAALRSEAEARLNNWLSDPDTSQAKAYARQIGAYFARPGWDSTQLHRWQLAEAAFFRLLHTPPNASRLVPVLKWHGSQCQYHQWAAKAWSGDFGKSEHFKRPIGPLILDKALKIAPLIVLGFLFSIGLGAAIGICAGWRTGDRFDRWSTGILFALDALPAFWAGMLLLVLFANPALLNWFPSTFEGRFMSPQNQVLRWVLPLIAIGYGGLAAVARNVRQLVADALQQDFARAARAKGVSSWRLAWRHAFPLALPVLINMGAGLLPALVGGAVYIEYVFGINGLGDAILEATQANDTAFMAAIFTLTGLFTALGYLVADLLSAWADPRIRLNSRQV